MLQDICTLTQGEGDDGFALKRVGCIVGRVAGGLLYRDGGVQLAGGDLFCCGGDVAELAGREVALGGSHGRAEGAADDGTMPVKIAGAGCWIEDRAGLVLADGIFRFIGEEDGVSVVLAENAGDGIAGKERSKPLKRIFYPDGDARSALRIATFEKVKTLTQTGSVLLRDREDAMTALRAAGVAGEVMPAALDGGSQGSVDDLDEAGVVTAFVWLRHRIETLQIQLYRKGRKSRRLRLAAIRCVVKRVLQMSLVLADKWPERKREPGCPDRFRDESFLLQQR